MKTEGSRIIYLLGAGLAFLLAPIMVHATPYASGITNNSGTIQYILNETATDVKVYFDNNTVSNDFGALTAGLNSFSLGVHTNFSIVVSKIGAGTPSQISVDTTNNSFFGPRGVAVNTNPKTHNFGRIYVVNSSAGTGTPAPGRAVGRGLYVMNADTSDALGRFGTASLGGATLGSSTTYSLYKTFVGPDDMVYAGDATGGYTGTPGGASVWMFDPDINTATAVLKWVGTSVTNFGGTLSTPVVTGSLAAGNLNLYCVEWGFGTNLGSAGTMYCDILGYNVGGTLPCTAAPTTNAPVGGTGIATTDGIVGDLAVAPDGKFFATQNRSSATGGNDGFWVYASDGVTYLWDGLTAWGGSQSPASGTDPFSGIYGVAVSPDDKYCAVIHGSDSAYLLMKLTNGVPDISTLTTNVTGLSGTGRSVAFDAADNVYIISGGLDRLRAYSLGLTTTATTSNDKTGTNGTFSLVVPPTTVSVAATSNLASPTGPAPGVFQITRAGQNLTAPLTVTFVFSGTASNGLYTCSPAGITPFATNTITFAANQTTTNITITAVNDGVSRPTTTVVLTLKGGAGYTTTIPYQDTVAVQNVGPQELIISSAVVSSMYNAFSNSYAAFTVTRWGDTNAAAYTVSSFTTAGTAVSGVDFTAPAAITFNPGDLVYTNFVYPLRNGQLPVDSTANAFVGNKTIVVGVSAASGYTVATNTVALTVLDSAYPTATVLFADPLTDPADAANWGVTSANNNMQTNAIDNTITFGYDLQNGDPGDYGPIPLPPSGATTALRITVNKDSAAGSGAGAAVNLYPTNVTFSGNYSVRFNMNLIEGSGFPASSTEGAMFGINHSAQATNWWAGSAILSGWGAANTNVWESDGIWYWVSADNQYSGGNYLAYTGAGGKLPNTGWQLITAKTAASFVNAFPTNVFTTLGGPGLVANGSYFNILTANNWSDVEIKQFKGVVTLLIDKTPIIAYTNATSFTNGTLMLGYEDPFSSVGTLDASVYFSNLRVVAIGVPVITQIAINKSNSTSVINFSTVDGDLTASSFTLQSAATVTGPYTAASGATITSLSGGGFQAVVPQSGSAQFYRIQQN